MDQAPARADHQELAIYIFSFNRGRFLENCLKSVEACASDMPVTVIDDQSDDMQTRAVLDQYRDRLRVVIAGDAEITEHKTGGLYNNMRFAFEDALGSGRRFALFLQDDMQLVRPILPEDIAGAKTFFDANPNAAELHTCFMKRFYKHRDDTLTELDASGEAYLRPSDYPGFSGFSAVGLFDIERFRALFGDLKQGEYANNELAQKNHIQMGISARPFMMWLPYPISHRGKQRNLPLQLVEFVGGCGYYPLELMTDRKARAMLERDRRQRPYAEDWLECEKLKNTPVWSFAGGLSNLHSRGGLRAWLGRILQKFR